MNSYDDLVVGLNDKTHVGPQIVHVDEPQAGGTRWQHWPMELQHLGSNANSGKPKDQRLKEATHSGQEVHRTCVLVIEILLIEFCPNLFKGSQTGSAEVLYFQRL